MLCGANALQITTVINLRWTICLIPDIVSAESTLAVTIHWDLSCVFLDLFSRCNKTPGVASGTCAGPRCFQCLWLCASIKSIILCKLFFVAAALFVCGLGNAREHKTQASKMPFAPGPVSANQCKKVCGKHACVKYIREKKHYNHVQAPCVKHQCTGLMCITMQKECVGSLHVWKT